MFHVLIYNIFIMRVNSCVFTHKLEQRAYDNVKRRIHRYKELWYLAPKNIYRVEIAAHVSQYFT